MIDSKSRQGDRQADGGRLGAVHFAIAAAKIRARARIWLIADGIFAHFMMSVRVKLQQALSGGSRWGLLATLADGRSRNLHAER